MHNELLQELQKLITVFTYHDIFPGHLAFKVISWPDEAKNPYFSTLFGHRFRLPRLDLQ